MEKPNEPQDVPTWAKVLTLIGLVVLLIICIILPVKVVPQTLSLLSSTISSVFIPRELTNLIETTPTSSSTDIFIQAPTSTETIASNPEPVVEPAPAPVVSKPKPIAPVVSNPYGLPDLEVRIIATGFLNENNIFIPSDTIYSNQQAAVKFQIGNVGTNDTGAWGFSANLPSVTDSFYNSPLQQNLRPGDRIEFTLGFRNPTNTQNHVGTITANPSNTISENSKANNSANVYFPILNATSF